MHNRRFFTKALLCFVLSLTLCLSVFTFTAGAEREQDKALLSVHSSNTNPKPGDTITVTVKIDNYVSMVPFISAMHIDIGYDADIFEFADVECLLNVNTDDAVGLNEDGGVVSFYYVYSHNKPLDKISDFKIFSFDLTVKETVSVNTATTFDVKKCVLYNNNDKYSVIGCQSPMLVDELNIWASSAALLMNGSEENKGSYTTSVKLDFKSPSAQLTRNSGSVMTIESGYSCVHNGNYKLTLTVDGKSVEQSFTINKKVASVGVVYDPLFNDLEFMVGVDPSVYFSRGTVKVTYSDETSGDLPLSDSDFKITGYNMNMPGEQTVTIEYYGVKTSHTITFVEKGIASVSIDGALKYNQFLVNDPIETSGITLNVRFDDGSTDNAPINADMITYNNAIGAQSVTVKYGTYEYKDAFSVTFVSRERFDSFKTGLDALDLSTLTTADAERVTALVQLYNSFDEVEKRACTEDMRSKLASARAAVGSTEPTTPTASAAVSEDNSNDSSGSSKWLIIVIIVIVVLAALAGGGYFLLAYLKRKREDSEEYYYDENETNVYEDDFLPKFDENDKEDDDEE